ncbi:hypothetical protein lerEdw1_020875 [Lerista edwardsae]|nr:hypothetical protein lerEdw1_020875 [Lerista edwardsae]
MAKGDAVAGMKLPLEEGLLGRLLHSPDYNLFPNSVVFESNFVQVTKKGKWVGITNLPTIVAMGVTSSDPRLPLPNVLLMAKHKNLDRDLLSEDKARSPAASCLDLTRMLPLRSVRLFVHIAAQRILCLQMVTQKVYYLQLHQDHPNAVFALWARLATLLQKGPPPWLQYNMVPRSRASSAEGLPAWNQKDVPVRRNASFVSNDINALLCDMPQPGPCAWCKRRLRGALPRHRSELWTAPSDVALWPSLDGTSHELWWQQATPSRLQLLY